MGQRARSESRSPRHRADARGTGAIDSPRRRAESASGAKADFFREGENGTRFSILFDLRADAELDTAKALSPYPAFRRTELPSFDCIRLRSTSPYWITYKPPLPAALFRGAYSSLLYTHTRAHIHKHTHACSGEIAASFSGEHTPGRHAVNGRASLSSSSRAVEDVVPNSSGEQGGGGGLGLARRRSTSDEAAYAYGIGIGAETFGARAAAHLFPHQSTTGLDR